MSILANIDKENVNLYVDSCGFDRIWWISRKDFFRILSLQTSLMKYVFYSLIVALLVSVYFISKLSYEGEATIVKPKISDVTEILKDSRFTTIYFLYVCVFFVFGGVLNILPFRVKRYFK